MRLRKGKQRWLTWWFESQVKFTFCRYSVNSWLTGGIYHGRPGIEFSRPSTIRDIFSSKFCRSKVHRSGGRAVWWRHDRDAFRRDPVASFDIKVNQHGCCTMVKITLGRDGHQPRNGERFKVLLDMNSHPNDVNQSGRGPMQIHIQMQVNVCQRSRCPQMVFVWSPFE